MRTAIESDVTPITTHRHFTMDDFALATGYFVLNENKMTGAMPREDAHLMSLYKRLDNISRKAYYAAVKHCVSTPFGYWVSDVGRSALDDEIAELRAEVDDKNEEAASLALLGGFEPFRAVVNFVFLRSDPHDKVLRRRMPSFLIERLEGLKEKLENLDPENDKKALVYTQDQTKRLHMCLTGRYADAVRAAGDTARDIAHEIKLEPSKQYSMNFSKIDEAIGLLQAVEEKMEEGKLT